MLFLPEYEIAQLSQNTTPHEFRLDNGKYPIKDIFSVASLAGQRSIETARKQVQRLYSKNKIVIYWAILGLRSQQKATLIPSKAELTAASQDSYEPVAVIASAILYEAFQHPAAERALKESCVVNNKEIALMAVNELLYLTDTHPFIKTIQSQHKSLENTKSVVLSTAYKVKAACMDFLGSIGLVPNNPDYSE